MNKIRVSSDHRVFVNDTEIRCVQSFEVAQNYPSELTWDRVGMVHASRMPPMNTVSLKFPCDDAAYTDDVEPQQPQETSMNYSTVIFLINDDVRAVLCSYDIDAQGKAVAGTQRLFKTFDKALKPGDFVVVPTDTRHKMTVNRVEQVDVEVDPDSSAQMTFIIGKVDTAAHDKIVSIEQEAISSIKSAEKRSAKEKLREKLLADNPQLAELEAATGGTLLAAPPSPPERPYVSGGGPQADEF